VICHGNICRSPYLAALLQRALPEIEVTSAGLIAPGRSAPDHAMTVARRRGLDLSSHRSRVVTREMIANVDVVIVMEPGQASHVVRQFSLPLQRVLVAGDLDPTSVGSRSIRDPFLQPIEVFEGSYARLDRCAAVIAQTLARLRSADRV
jgi:protein-tyrosine phosphatase